MKSKWSDKLKKWMTITSLVLLVLQPFALVGYMRASAVTADITLNAVISAHEMLQMNAQKVAFNASEEVAMKSFGYTSRHNFDQTYERARASLDQQKAGLPELGKAHMFRLICTLILLISPFPAAIVILNSGYFLGRQKSDGMIS